MTPENWEQIKRNIEDCLTRPGYFFGGVIADRLSGRAMLYEVRRWMNELEEKNENLSHNPHG